MTGVTESRTDTGSQQAFDSETVTASEVLAFLTLFGAAIIALQYRSVVAGVELFQSVYGYIFVFVPVLFAMFAGYGVAKFFIDGIAGWVGVTLDEPFSEADRLAVVFAVIPLSAGVVAAMLYPFGLPENSVAVTGLLIGIQITATVTYPITQVSGLRE